MVAAAREEILEGSSWTFDYFNSEIAGVMSQNSLMARISQLASPDCKVPAKQDLF